MIKVPKLIFQLRNSQIRLDYIYHQVSEYDACIHQNQSILESFVTVMEDWKDQLGTATFENERTEDKLRLEEFIKSIESRFEPQFYEAIRTKARRKTTMLKLPETQKEVSEPGLVKLNKQVKMKRYEFKMNTFNIRQMVLKALYFIEINKSIKDGKWSFVTEFDFYFDRPCLFRFSPKIEILWYRALEPPFKIAVTIVCGTLSALLLVGELSIPYNFSVSNIPTRILMSTPILGPFLLYTFVIMTLIYTAVICYFGVFYLKIFGFYGFWKKHTVSSTLLSSALYASKLTMPIIYNFLMIFFREDKEKTDFHDSIGNLDVVPVLGYNLPRYMPTLLLLIVLFNLLNVYGRIMKLFGFSVFEMKHESDSVQAGKVTVQVRKITLLEELQNRGDTTLSIVDSAAMMNAKSFKFYRDDADLDTVSDEYFRAESKLK